MSAWCPVALLGAAFLILVVAESPPLNRTKRLTAFGKTPTTETESKTNPDDGSTKNLYVPYTHGTPRGKKCSTDQECEALESTMCKVDTDNQKRCLCHDLKAPVNGECATKRRELHQACSYDHECIQGAECVVNSTINAKEKRCYCKFGYEEEDNECNSGQILSAVVTLVLFTTLALLTTQPN